MGCFDCLFFLLVLGRSTTAPTRWRESKPGTAAGCRWLLPVVCRFVPAGIVGGSTTTPADLLLLGLDRSSAAANPKGDDDDNDNDAGAEGCAEETPGGGRGAPTRTRVNRADGRSPMGASHLLAKADLVGAEGRGERPTLASAFPKAMSRSAAWSSSKPCVLAMMESTCLWRDKDGFNGNQSVEE